MPRLTPSRNTFSGGEWAPSLWGRWDHEKYDTACRTLKNWFVRPHGSASNRGGTYFVGEVRNSAKPVREIPFQFSTVQTYMLILNDGYMQVVKGYDFVTSGGSRVEFAIPWADADLPDLQYAQTADTIYVVHPSYVPRTITRSSDTAWTIATVSIGSAQAAPTNISRGVGSGTTHKFVITSTSGTDEESVASSAVQAGNGDTIVWTPASGAAWNTIYKDSNGASGMYGWMADVGPKTGEGVVKAISGITQANPGVVTTSSAHSFAAGDIVTIRSVVGMTEVNDVYFKVGASPTTYTFHLHSVSADTDVNTTGYGAYVSGGSVQIAGSYVVQDLSEDMETTPPEDKDPFSGADNYPGSVAFFQGRLLYARTNNKPDGLWASKVWHYNNFNKSHALRDDDSWDWTLAASSLNAITWLMPLDKLLVGSGGTEWRVDGGSSSDAITPTSISVRVQSAWGSAWEMPQIVGDTVLMLLFGRNIVRELAYSLAVDAYAGYDRTIMARHLMDGHTVDDWAYQRQPDSILWCVRDDGTLLGFTYLREQEVYAWHRHETDGWFENVACVPSGSVTDDLYVVVRRTINGATKRYIELLEPRLPTDDVKDAFFVDCGMSVDSPIAISGITNADPAVVTTATAHGFAEGDLVDIADCEGMTEVNGYRFRVANPTTYTFELHDPASDSFEDDFTGYTATEQVVHACDSATNWTYGTDATAIDLEATAQPLYGPALKLSYTRSAGLAWARYTPASPINMSGKTVLAIPYRVTDGKEESLSMVRIYSNPGGGSVWRSYVKFKTPEPSSGDVQTSDLWMYALIDLANPDTSPGANLAAVEAIQLEFNIPLNRGTQLHIGEIRARTEIASGTGGQYRPPHAVWPMGVADVQYYESPYFLRLWSSSMNPTWGPLYDLCDGTGRAILDGVDMRQDFSATAQVRLGTNKNFALEWDRCDLGYYAAYIDQASQKVGIEFLDAGDRTYVDADWLIQADVWYDLRVEIIDSVANLYINDNFAIDMPLYTRRGGQIALRTEATTWSPETAQCDQGIADIRYLKLWDSIDSSEYGVYVEGGVVRKAVTSVTGLSHLEGKEVAVLADGGVVPGRSISSGALTPALEVPASRIHVGLAYMCDLQTLDFQLGDASRTTQDQRRRISSAVIYCEKTRAMSVGPDADHLTDVLFRDITVPGGWPAPLFTGAKEVDLFAADTVDVSSAFVRVSDPLPATILAIIPRLSIGGP